MPMVVPSGSSPLYPLPIFSGSSKDPIVPFFPRPPRAQNPRAHMPPLVVNMGLFPSLTAERRIRVFIPQRFPKSREGPGGKGCNGAVWLLSCGFCLLSPTPRLLSLAPESSAILSCGPSLAPPFFSPLFQMLPPPLLPPPVSLSRFHFLVIWPCALGHCTHLLAGDIIHLVESQAFLLLSGA